MTVYEKLIEVQNKLKAPKLQFNSFGKYNYRNAEDILEAVKPILKEFRVVVFIKDDIELIGDRYYVRAIAKFVDIETGEGIEVAAYAREEENKKGMDGSQVTGAASSYARKYALNGLFCIDDTKDADFAQGKEEHRKLETPINQVGIDKINELIKTTATEEKKFLQYFKVEKVEELNSTQADEAIKLLNKKIK